MTEMFTAWVSAGTLGLLISTFWMVAMTIRYVKRLEAKVDALLKHSGTDVLPPDRGHK